MGMIGHSASSSFHPPPAAKRSKFILDQEHKQKHQQQQQQQQQQLHQHEQQKHFQMAHFWRHPSSYSMHQQQHQLTTAYWPITPPQTFQAPCDFYNCKVMQRQHSRYMQQQAAVAAHAQAAAVRRATMHMPPTTTHAHMQMGMPSAVIPMGRGYVKMTGRAAQPAPAPRPVCIDCVNGSCRVAWNKENVGVMRSLWIIIIIMRGDLSLSEQEFLPTKDFSHTSIFLEVNVKIFSLRVGKIRVKISKICVERLNSRRRGSLRRHFENGGTIFWRPPSPHYTYGCY